MAKYAFIENNEIIGLYNDLPKNWRNISNFYALESDPEYLSSLGWKLIQRSTVKHNPDTQSAEITYSIVGDSVVESIIVTDLPPLTNEELIRIKKVKHDNAMSILRNKRDQLLIDSDVTQLLDITKKNGPTLTAAYETYRQQLRDLPNVYDNDENFIDESTVVYPTVGGI